MLLQEYLDGELSPSQEVDLDQHIAACSICLNELNLQKCLLGVLADDIGPELPEGFAEIVATKADSQVAGLRRTKERKYAISIAAFLFLIALALLAFDVARPISSLKVLFGKLSTFVAVIGGIVADLAIGLYVITKVFAQQAGQSTAIFVFVVALTITGFVVWAVRSGKLFQFKEIKR